ncbi:hypothetical protein BGX30_005277, partial [Mortierella sp. GBA39]
DRLLATALRNNLLWVFVGTLACVAFGLLIAILADRSSYERIAKSIIFMPMAISFVAAGVIWKFVYYYQPGDEQIGLLNAIVMALGGEPQAWVSMLQPWNNFFLIIILIWMQTGFAMVIFSAAIKGVPDDILEASRVDGAGEIRIFFRIIIPFISTTILTVTTTIIVFTLKIFDVVMVMTGGQYGTEVVATQFYRQFFMYRNFGYGSTLAIVLLIAVLPDTIQLSKDVDLRGPIEVNGQKYTDDQLKSGVMQDGKRLTWENRRAREISVQDQGWVGSSKLTLDNYKNAFWNTLTIAVPATVIPVLIASFAAYAFAWLRFPGRKTLFVVIIAMLVIPIQVALIPVLKDYTSLGLNGSYLGIWLAHTAFGLPLVTYFMYNFISQLPKDLFESAFMDGATHFTIFSRLILPLSVPALASIGIFQFLWVWNDYLVSLIFIGNQPEVQVMSMKIADLVGSRGNDWHLLTSAAFISMLMPLAIFFLLQKYFVRGLMGGSVKG